MREPSGLGRFRTAAAAPQPLTEVAAVGVDSLIYLLGGLNESGVTRRVEIYDPKTDRWSSGPALPAAAPTHHLAVAVSQEHIYVLGGYLDALFTATASTWRLEPQSGVWTQRSDQPLARGAATAQTLGDLIYVAGGAVKGQPTSALYSYDPQLDTWQMRTPSTLVREHLASCADGVRMVVVGGRTAQGNLDSTEIYDAGADRWISAARMPTARGGLAAVTLNSRCYVVGGEEPSEAPPNTFGQNEGFDLMTQAWAAYAPLPTPRHGLAAVALLGSIYVLAGGPRAGFTYSPVVEVFTP